MSDGKDLPCDFESELPLLLYQGELEREERERLRAHLATCPRCEEAFSQLETTAIALDGAMAVPKPSPEQWRKLKENVLSRVAAPPTPADAAPAEHEACESIEEDLLVLSEVGPERKQALLAHVQGCVSCRDARSAFGSIGVVLNRQPLEWPSVARWDALKESVLTAIKAEATGTKEGAKPAAARPSLPLPWGTINRVVIGVVALVGLTGTLALVRSPSPDDVRRQWHVAQSAGTLEGVTHAYERVLSEGMAMPECRDVVDDSLYQLQAIHRFQFAYDQPNREAKRSQMLEVMVRFPNSRVTDLALAEYNKLVNAAQGVALQDSSFKTELGKLDPTIDPRTIKRYTQRLEEEYVSLPDLGEENLRKKHEYRGALATAYFQQGQSERENRDAALADFKKALEYAEPNSPAALEAGARIKSLRGN